MDSIAHSSQPAAISDPHTENRLDSLCMSSCNSQPQWELKSAPRTASCWAGSGAPTSPEQLSANLGLPVNYANAFCVEIGGSLVGSLEPVPGCSSESCIEAELH